MRRIESDRYDTMCLKGAGNRLSVVGETLERTREEIDESNKRAVRMGYKASQWIITHIEHYAWFDDNDRFIKSEDIESAVEVYPKEI